MSTRVPGSIRRVQAVGSAAAPSPTQVTTTQNATTTSSQPRRQLSKQGSLATGSSEVVTVPPRRQLGSLANATAREMRRMNSEVDEESDIADGQSSVGTADTLNPTRSMKRNQRRSVRRLEKRMSTVRDVVGATGDMSLDEMLATEPAKQAPAPRVPPAPLSSAGSGQMTLEEYGPIERLDGPSREKWLRKTLLQFVVKDELDRFFADPRWIGEGHPNLLSMVYEKLVRMPMFAHRGPSFRTVLDRFLLFLPDFNMRYFKATGHDFSKRMINGIAGSLTMSLQSSEERKKFKRANRAKNASIDGTATATTPMPTPSSSSASGPSGPTGKPKPKEKGARRREFLDAISAVLLDVESEAGLKALLDSIAAAHSVHDLPPSLRRVFNLQMDMLTSKINKIRDERDVKSFKRTFHSMPRRSIMALLKVAQPATLLKGLFALASSSAFGGVNAMQRLFEGRIGLSACEEDLAAAARKIDLAVHERIRALVKSKLVYDVLGFVPANVVAYVDGIAIVGGTPHSATRADVAAVGRNAFANRKWSDNELRAVHVVIVLEIRYRDKVHFIDAVAGPAVNELLDEVLPALQELLGDMINTGGFSRFISRVFEAWEGLVETVDDSTLTEDARLRRIQSSVGMLQDAMYQFLHRAIIHDTGSVRELLVWLVTSQYRASAGFDIKPLVDTLPTGIVAADATSAPAMASSSTSPASAATVPGVPASTHTGLSADSTAESADEGPLRRALWAELDRIAHYHRFVIKGKGGKDVMCRPPPPPMHVKVVPILLPQFHGMLLDHLKTEDSSVYSQALRRVSRSLGLARGGKSVAGIVLPQRQSTLAVTHIELTYGQDVGPYLQSEGWQRTYHDLKSGTGASSIFLYYKTSLLANPTRDQSVSGIAGGSAQLKRQESDATPTQLNIDPITTVIVSASSAEDESLLRLGFVRIQQNLNKGTFGRKLNVWYKRGEPDKKPIVALATSAGKDSELSKDGFVRIDVSTNKGNMGKPVFIWYKRG